MYGLNKPINKTIVQDIRNENWGKFDKLDDRDYCGICMIERTNKSRHCPNVNLCIPQYHKYSYFFDMPVYFANQKTYLLLIMLEFIALLVYNLSYFDYVGYEMLESRTIILRIPFMIYCLINRSDYFTTLLYLITTKLLLVKAFHLAIFIYAISSNMTLDELYNPHYYRYLFKESPRVEGKWVFSNPENFGFLANWRSFLSSSSKLQITNY